MFSSLSFADLPLRPSTTTLLQQSGFWTLGELMETKTKSGGLAILATELQVDLQEVMRILQEIQDSLHSDRLATSNHSTEGTITAASASVPGVGTASTSISTVTNDSADRGDRRPQSAFVVTPPPAITAQDLLLESSNSTKVGGIITFCKAADQLFQQQEQQHHGARHNPSTGIPLGSLTEIAGLPGLGKTQWGMQLAVNARLPTNLGGVQGQTLYIDTEGSLVPDRLQTMAKALLQHCQNTLSKRGRTLPPGFCQPEDILQDIHIFRVLDEASQTSTLYSLPYWIKKLSTSEVPVKLIVIDSIAFHYRSYGALSSNASNNQYSRKSSGKDNHFQRTHALTQLAGFLNDLARQYKVAVVCINQMTTKIINGNTKLVPALGESWAHAVTTRLILSEDSMNTNISGQGRRRFCRLVKSPCMPPGIAYYQIKDVGIRDIQKQPQSQPQPQRWQEVSAPVQSQNSGDHQITRNEEEGVVMDRSQDRSKRFRTH